MDPGAVFEAWAPRRGRWTPWAKAVLFADLEDVSVEGFALPRATRVSADLLATEEIASSYRIDAGRQAQAVVVDLPGIEGLAVGLALADLGFRPVPLYTALSARSAVVPMQDMVRGLIVAADALREVAPSAPPAFLLDSRRDGEGAARRIGQLDNRSMAFATDFPSGGALLDAGIRTVTVVLDARASIATDLVETLLDWQGAGLRLSVARAGDAGPPAPLRVRSPSIIDRVALWWKRRALERDAGGAFGRWILERPQGG